MAPFWSVATGLPIVDEDLENIAARTLGPFESCLLHDPSGEQTDVWIAVAHDLPAPGRVHLDIVATEEDELAILAAGATLVRRAEDLSVFTDPEGNEFCLIRSRH